MYPIRAQYYLVDERGGELLRDVGLYNGLEPFELRLPRGGEDVNQGVEHLTNHSSVLPHTDQSQLSIVTLRPITAQYYLARVWRGVAVLRDEHREERVQDVGQELDNLLPSLEGEQLNKTYFDFDR